MTLSADELIIDLFAGGGGASEAIFQATGRHPDVAINHDQDAVQVHALNHPTTEHYCQNIWKVRPDDVHPERPIGLLWASPDCRHFSRASGGKPRWKAVRSLPGVVLTWAARRKPRLIFLENVAEFTTWGPLLVDGTPCQKRAGRSFRSFVGRLRGLGYKVEWRMICAADFGAPTTRTRLFLAARCDDEPIRWPQPTHRKNGGGLLEQPWRSAAECIDWTRPCPSIFTRKRPLAEKTLKRIAAGIQKFVINAAEPFIVPMDDGARVSPIMAGCGGRAGQSPPKSAAEPLNTITTKADQILVAPVIEKFYGTARGSAADQPLHTVTGQGGKHALVSPTLVQVGWGEREGQAPRVPGLDKPLGTVVAGGAKHALVAAHLATIDHQGSSNGTASAEAPLSTITSKARHIEVAAFLAQHNGGVIGNAADRPVSTITQSGSQQNVVEAALVPADETEEDRRAADVMAFLLRYNGGPSLGQMPGQPLGTVTTKERFAVVMVKGVPHRIVDIGMRMLHWTELAAAQAFPKSYILDRGADGRVLGKTVAIRLIGNSVSPPPATALLLSNLGRPVEQRAAA